MAPVSLRTSDPVPGHPAAAQAGRTQPRPLADRALLCVATADSGLRRRAAEACARLGHSAAEAASLEELARVAGAGLALAIIHPRLPGLGDNPVGRLRAEPALHRCPLLLLTPSDIKGLRSRAADTDLISLVVRIQLQIAGNQQIAFLNELNQALTASPDMTTTMRAVLDATARELPFDTASLFLLDPLGRLRVRAASGYELKEEQLRSFKVGEGV